MKSIHQGVCHFSEQTKTTFNTKSNWRIEVRHAKSGIEPGAACFIGYPSYNKCVFGEVFQFYDICGVEV